jgi:ribosomal protein L37AE/L43A
VDRPDDVDELAELERVAHRGSDGRGLSDLEDLSDLDSLSDLESLSDLGGLSHQGRSVGSDDSMRHPVETFDPLLRDLVAWGLVDRDDDGAGAWRLVDAAQRRLSELVAVSGKRSAESLLYFDHLCSRCHRRELTRLIGGSYVCAPCNDATLDEEMRVDMPEVGERRQRQARRRKRGRMDESGPMAS